MDGATKVITSEGQKKTAAVVRLKNIGLRGVMVADTSPRPSGSSLPTLTFAERSGL